MELIDGVENVEEPKEGMTFDSLDELASHYRTYAKQQGFGVVKRSKKKACKWAYMLHYPRMCTSRHQKSQFK
jgi:hypothetical protein